MTPKDGSGGGATSRQRILSHQRYPRPNPTQGVMDYEFPFFSLQTEPYLYVEQAKHREYPQGYTIEQLGSPHMLPTLNGTVADASAY